MRNVTHLFTCYLLKKSSGIWYSVAVTQYGFCSRDNRDFAHSKTYCNSNVHWKQLNVPFSCRWYQGDFRNFIIKICKVFWPFSFNFYGIYWPFSSHQTRYSSLNYTTILNNLPQYQQSCQKLHRSRDYKHRPIHVCVKGGGGHFQYILTLICKSFIMLFAWWRLSAAQISWHQKNAT